MKSIAVFTNKGGVGKTTLLCNLAAILAKHGKKILVVDADPQTNATQYMFDDEVLEEVYDKKVSTQFTLWQNHYLREKVFPKTIVFDSPTHISQVIR
jgi:cellulose biosynthesis protein BcsQ